MGAPALNVAIVGSGPAGFYAAAALLSSEEVEATVHMIERLPTPWGLVRGGVAPDHPKIKNVAKKYAQTAEHERFEYFGNLELGVDLSRDDLLERYDAVVYAVGTQTDNSLGIPGEDLPGSWAATEFVGWYNGHPDYADLDFDLSHPRVVVIGNGNVAVDCARMLSLPPGELSVTDTADHAVEVMGGAAIEEIVLMGRRGPAQAAFTHPELRELTELTRATLDVDPADLAEGAPGADLAEDATPTARRNVELLREWASSKQEAKPQSVRLRFLTSPVEIVGDGRVEGVRVVRNELMDGRPRPTGDEELIEAGLVLRAVGYRGVEIEGLPFDADRGIIPNAEGRIDDRPREYATGWIKRGPSGVIGTNKKCANETVAALVADAGGAGLNGPGADPDELAEWLAGLKPDVVTQAHWDRIDAHERTTGEPHGRPRVKLATVQRLLEIAHGEEVGAPGSR